MSNEEMSPVNVSSGFVTPAGLSEDIWWWLSTVLSASWQPIQPQQTEGIYPVFAPSGILYVFRMSLL